MSPALVVDNLFKVYPGARKSPPVEAVRGISFSVEKGRFLGVLGPNGAGKTTTLGCITTLIRPTSGKVFVDGVDTALDPDGVKRQIAVVPQSRNLDGELKVREILTYHARYFGLSAAEREKRADRLLGQMGLTEKANADPDKLSGGMQQKLLLARALMHNPKLLLLDEPTNGLDPQARRSLWELLQELHHEGLTIILTTHYMEEADRLCESLAIIDHGKIAAIDTPSVLKNNLPGNRILDVFVRNTSSLTNLGSGIPGVLKVERIQPQNGNGDMETSGLERFRFFLDSADGAVNHVFHTLGQQGAELHHVTLAEPSLEDVYLHITGKELRP